MGKKSSNYLMLYHKLIPIKLPHIESKISDIPNHIWEPATAVWRNAWRDAGVLKLSIYIFLRRYIPRSMRLGRTVICGRMFCI